MSDFFNKYPYTDFHELNLDWVINEIKNLNEKVKNIEIDALSVYQTYQSSDECNLKGDGIYDNSIAFSNISTNVALKPGNYRIAASCIIDANIVFCGGATIYIDAGCTVKFNKQIIANEYEHIFTGPGNVSAVGDGYAEWFGAVVNNSGIDNSYAINKAYHSFDGLILHGGKYYVNSTVIFDQDGKYVKGIGSGRALGSPDSQSVITTTSTTLSPIVKIGNSSGLWSGLFSYFGAVRENNGGQDMIGVEILNTIQTQFNTIFSRSTKCFHCVGNVHATFDKCLAMIRGAGSGYDQYGFYFANTDTNPATNTKGNVSIYLTNTTIEGSGAQQIGVYHDEGAGDFYIDGLEATYIHTGLSFVGNNATGLHDVHLNRIVVDNFSQYGIRIINAPNAQVTINGGYFYGAFNALRLYNTVGVVVSNCEFFYSVVNDTAAIYLEKCNGFTSRNNNIYGVGYNLQDICTNITLEDYFYTNIARNQPILYCANASMLSYAPQVFGTGTFQRALYAGALYRGYINLTGMTASRFTNAIVNIAGTDYTAVGPTAGGYNQIVGAYY